MDKKRTNLDSTTLPTDSFLSAAQIAFAEVLGEALARRWVSEQQRAPAAVLLDGTGQNEHRAQKT